MYYIPVQEPLNAFDRLMITNDKQAIEASKFNTEYIDPPQFVNLLNNYCYSALLKSEADTNRFITYVKDNFLESQLERNKKMEYVRKKKRKICLY